MYNYKVIGAQSAIAHAIQSGIILHGRKCTVGRYRTATGTGSDYAVIPTKGSEHETHYRDCGGAAQRFIILEGIDAAQMAFDRAIENWLSY